MFRHTLEYDSSADRWAKTHTRINNGERTNQIVYKGTIIGKCYLATALCSLAQFDHYGRWIESIRPLLQIGEILSYAYHGVSSD